MSSFAQTADGRIPAKGFAVYEEKGHFQPYEFSRHAVGDNDIQIEILYAGICHSDLHHVFADWGAEEYPMVPGHEIAGRVFALLCNTSCAQNRGVKESGNSVVTTNQTESKSMKGKKVLVAFFSHTGENYGVGNIAKGNTHIVAEMIAKETGGELFEIVPVKEYPKTYDACVDVAKREKETGAHPAVKGDIAVEDYDVVFIGYPNWWGDMPMPVYTFIGKHNWTDKTVIPFCTHEGSGLSDTERNIAGACKGATVEKGLALRGTTAQNKQEQARRSVQDWVKKSGF